MRPHGMQLLELLFVYGTLMRGGRTTIAKLLHSRGIFVGDATMQGELYSLGSYPGAILKPGHSLISGEVFQLPHDGGRLLRSLDRYEGCYASDPEPHLFRRHRANAQMADKTIVHLWTYTYAGDLTNRARIPQWHGRS